MCSTPATRRFGHTLEAMHTITGCTRDTQLFMHAMGAALACTADGEVLELDLAGAREPSPAAQKALVFERLDSVLRHIDTMLRSKKTPPSAAPTATLGRRLVANGENYDAVARTYTPGPGFEALVQGLISDAASYMTYQAIQSGQIGN